MLTDLAGWAPQTGAVGLLLSVFWLVYTGRLVPGRIHEETRRDRDAYRAAAETAIAASREHAANQAQLLRAVEQLSAAQRETTDLVRRLIPTERSTS